MHGISPCEIKGESCSEFLPSISKLWEMRSWAFTNIFSTRQKTISNLIVFLYIKYIQATGLLATSQQNVINEATFRTESSSVSNNIKFQIFQNRFIMFSHFLLTRLNALMFMQITAIMVIIFWDFLTFTQIFLPLQVKQSQIFSNKRRIYELPHDLPNDLRLRILGN